MLLVATGIGLAGIPAAWLISDHVESDNAFCVSCHLAPGEPLHQTKFDEFLAAPAVSLVAAHRVAQDDFRCVDCHGGTGLAGRARVKAVTLLDTLRYVSGRFGEPERMRHPLWDEDCVKCHPRYRPARDDAFHAIAVHNADFPWSCVECHEAHPATRAPEFDFVPRERALAICRTCHEEF